MDVIESGCVGLNLSREENGRRRGKEENRRNENENMKREI